MAEYAEEELQAARDALSDAAILEGEETDEAVVNRPYYACFHAAQAVLYPKGFEPRTHQGVAMLFGREVVLNGEASEDDGRLLNKLRDYREQADYDHDPIEADVDALFERVEAFVATIEELA
jgi:uncharacterized protein (UPF0332 family)